MFFSVSKFVKLVRLNTPVVHFWPMGHMFDTTKEKKTVFLVMSYVSETNKVCYEPYGLSGVPV